MSTTTNNAEITLQFTDETTKTFTLPSLTAGALSYVKPRCQAINAGTATDVADFRATFLSTAGASFVSISGAKIISTVEDVIYSG